MHYINENDVMKRMKITDELIHQNDEEFQESSCNKTFNIRIKSVKQFDNASATYVSQFVAKSEILIIFNETN